MLPSPAELPMQDIANKNPRDSKQRVQGQAQTRAGLAMEWNIHGIDCGLCYGKQ